MIASINPDERRRLGAFFGLSLALHVVGFGALLLFGLRHPALLGLGGLAYTFGLRHAFDADHISAIDNTTRKLLREGKQPLGTGFFFSLGHSTVVFLISLLLALAVRGVMTSVVGNQGQLHRLGSLLGTGVSGTFLLLIGTLNLLVLLDIIRSYRAMRRSGPSSQVAQDLVAGGLMTRAFNRLFGLVTQSWHLYPIGFLFGLGFDTASEVALLASTGTVAAQGQPLLVVLALPTIFAAGMSIMDTADGAFMAKAYAWAFTSPIRKVFYNLTMTGLSVFVALLIGAVEISQLVGQALGFSGGAWSALDHVNFNLLGILIVLAFVLTWAIALLLFKLRRIEERWMTLLPEPD